jgi:hypothetical protein
MRLVRLENALALIALSLACVAVCTAESRTPTRREPPATQGPQSCSWAGDRCSRADAEPPPGLPAKRTN